MILYIDKLDIEISISNMLKYINFKFKQKPFSVVVRGK